MQLSNKIIDGKSIANSIKEELTLKISNMKLSHNIVPGLAVVLVGNRTDSSTYVRMKKQAAIDIGMNFVLKEYDENITHDELLSEVRSLNNNPLIHGLIVQLPLPSHIHEQSILNEVSSYLVYKFDDTIWYIISLSELLKLNDEFFFI